MPSLLALDCSKYVGWAFFRSADDMPYCRTWEGKDSWLSDDYGPYFHEFRVWLLNTIAVYKPDVLAFESPILGVRRDQRGTDEQNVRRLVGVVSIAEEVAHELGLKCLEINNQNAKEFMGVPGRRPQDMTVGQYKDLMVVAITNRGYSVADSHQADACAVALVAYSELGQ